MNDWIFFTAFGLGFAGSLHCVGMCGAIVLSLPGSAAQRSRLIFSRLFYNFGRIVTYSLLGGIIGIFGKGLSLAGVQQWVSIAAGLTILLLYFLPKAKLPFQTGVQSFFQPFSRLYKGVFARQLAEKTLLSGWLIGLLNGLLPCGLVYLALAGSLAAGSIYGGAAYMAMFGLGTLPVLLFLGLAGGWLRKTLLPKAGKMVPAFVVLVAALFILRGLNLGIPYLSPSLQSPHSETIVTGKSCH